MQDVLMEKDKNLQGITQNLIKEAENWKDTHYKPIIEKLMSDI